MDVRLINPFISATKEVFRLMAGCEVKPQPPEVFSTLPRDAKMLNAVIEMRGGADGVLILRFPTNVILPVATAFAGSSVSYHNAFDAIGELANMITGNAKRRISQRLINISIPRTCIGDSELGKISERSPWLYVPFVASLGVFFMAINITTISKRGSIDASLDPEADGLLEGCNYEAATIQ